MERKFYTNDFEHLLKENADQFKMSPSKKVWHGIYNDIHPGRRWPSIAMSLLFVFTLVLVGYLNIEQSEQKQVSNDQKNNHLEKDKIQVLTDKLNRTPQQNTSPHGKTAPAPDHQINKVSIKGEESKSGLKQIGNGNVYIPAQKKSIETILTNSQVDTKTPSVALISKGEQININNISSAISEAADRISDKNLTALEVAPLIEPFPLNTSNIYPAHNIVPAPVPLGSRDPELPGITNETVKTGLVLKNESSVNDAKNKTGTASLLKRHRNAKITWAYYLSPGISYRTYSKQGNPADQAFLGYGTPSYNSNLNDAVTHLMSPGLEAGTALKYSLSKKWRFTAGIQLNYSAYTVQANNIHPIIATLVLHDKRAGNPYAVSAISYFGNGPGNVPVNLHNYSVQLGVPIGLEYQLAGNDRVQFSAAASFQPSAIIANKSYILSTDKRNYLTDASLVRNWNFGTNIGPLISFSSNKFKWQIGPQVHYQLLSTYKNEYQVREHFIDYNIRFAISRIVK